MSNPLSLALFGGSTGRLPAGFHVPYSCYRIIRKAHSNSIRLHSDPWAVELQHLVLQLRVHEKHRRGHFASEGR